MSDKNRFHGPLRVSPVNPRYFTDERGRAIYLTGAHTWANLVDIGLAGDPPFDYAKYLDFMTERGHNFMRMWTWDHPEMAPWTADKLYFDPMPHARTGPGLALDGKPKFDLSCFNEAYFDRLRQRVLLAGTRGIYVSVMLFEGYCVKNARPGRDPWLSHPYNIQNNVNGVDGDPNKDGRADIYCLDVPEVVEYQKRYIRKVIDTVGDLDNILYEILNEIPNDERGVRWQYHIIDYIHEVERGKPKQHPVGMTAEGGTQDNPILFASPAEWISPGAGPQQEYRNDPPAADGSKVILADTDHFWGHGGHYRWVWKSFLRGLNPLFMDPYAPIPGSGYANATYNAPDYPDWEPLRWNLGHTRRYAERMDLLHMTPHGELCSSRYCLANPGKEYLIYIPDDAQTSVYLAGERDYAVEWFSPLTGKTASAAPMRGGRRYRLVSPLGMDVVLYLKAE
jgi:hypothetical protein